MPPEWIYSEPDAEVYTEFFQAVGLVGLIGLVGWVGWLVGWLVTSAIWPVA